jgi:hypothetical protein
VASFSEVNEITYSTFCDARVLKMKLLQSLSAKVVRINKSSWDLSVQQGKLISPRLYKHIFPILVYWRCLRPVNLKLSVSTSMHMHEHGTHFQFHAI